MPTEQNTLKGLQIIYKTLLLGQIIFAAIALFLKYNNKIPSSLSSKDQVFQVIAVVVSFAGFFVGSSILKKRLQQLRESSADIKTKSSAYRSASITQWALLEAPSIFCIICFFNCWQLCFSCVECSTNIYFCINDAIQNQNNASIEIK